jgi:hypothetical protein
VVTLFDFITVCCFVGMTIIYLWSSRDPRVLAQLVLAGIVFAVANQVGNSGETALAFAMIIAGAGYAVLAVRPR